MPRPKRDRSVCALPESNEFHPIAAENNQQKQAIVLTVDEYEAIRLIDYHGLAQTEGAQYMAVSRTTIQEIYSCARKKIAAALVEARPLKIQGGEYKLCDDTQNACRCRGCAKHKQLRRKQGESIMKKIAVAYENGQIFQHFGHTEIFKLYTVQDGKITGSELMDTQGNGHGALAQLLQAHEVDTLICGGIGAGAQNALAQAGIQLYGGVAGQADAAVEALLKNQLAYNPQVQCSHHTHEHGEGEHSCGSHGCGQGTCGN